MKFIWAAGALVLFAGFSVSCSTGSSRISDPVTRGVWPESFTPPRAVVVRRKRAKVYHGKASWYSVRTNGGTRTASGERLRDGALTAAHRSLPFGTRVRVTNKKNGKRVVVRITDRGPYIRGRIIDVSKAAAHRIGMVKAGVVPVSVELLGKRT